MADDDELGAVLAVRTLRGIAAPRLALDEAGLAAALAETDVRLLLLAAGHPAATAKAATIRPEIVRIVLARPDQLEEAERLAERLGAFRVLVKPLSRTAIERAGREGLDAYPRRPPIGEGRSRVAG